MLKVLTTKEMRVLDEHTIQQTGIPGIVLMERAAQGCVDVILNKIEEEHPDEPLIYIFAGNGNNGGDGLAIARYLHESGYDVVVFSTCQPEDYKGDALINARIVQQLDIPWEVLTSAEVLYELEPPDLIVDALFGTGFKGKMEGLFADLVEFINDSDAMVIAVDIPSGVNGDKPVLSGPSVQADLTVTMAAPKPAHLFYPTRTNTGELYVADIGIPLISMFQEKHKFHLVEKEDIVLPRRDPAAHKYQFGRILIVAGSMGLMGAPVMAARAASLIGGGMVHLAVPESVYTIAAQHLLGEIVIPVEDNDDGIFSEAALPQIRTELKWADVVLIGPGIGRHHNTLSFLQFLLDELDIPTIFDADSLFLLAQNNLMKKIKGKSFLLTPHYGEFATLAGMDSDTIKADPLSAAVQFSQQQGVVLNLKNAPSLVATPSGEVFINNSGNSALAKGGSGDVLAGMIAGLMGLGLNAIDASMVGNYIHGYLADIYTEQNGFHGLTPEIQLELLPTVIREFE
ncbi:MAG: NAD(P)H-hydrate dehydratase [Calditrichia bacterium]